MTLAITAISTEDALSDIILQSARTVIEQYAEKSSLYYQSSRWNDCHIKNLPLLILLDQLIGACAPVAAAIADNAWDNCQPISSASSEYLISSLRRIIDDITAAASAPNAVNWSLPSCTGKELV